MCGGGSAPPPPPPPPDPIPAPQLPDSGVQSAGTDQKMKAQLSAGMQQNIATGPQGLTEPANTTAGSKTMLGS